MYTAYGQLFVLPLLLNTLASGKVETKLYSFSILHLNNPEKNL